MVRYLPALWQPRHRALFGRFSSILNSNHGALWALCWISSAFGSWWMAENSTEGGWENAEPEREKVRNRNEMQIKRDTIKECEHLKKKKIEVGRKGEEKEKGNSNGGKVCYKNVQPGRKLMLKSQQHGLIPLCSGEIPDLRQRPVLQEPAWEILMGAKEAPWILSVAEQETTRPSWGMNFIWWHQFPRNACKRGRISQNALVVGASMCVTVNALLLGKDTAGEAFWFSALLLLPQERPVRHKQHRMSLRESRKQEGMEGTERWGWRKEKRNKKLKRSYSISVHSEVWDRQKLKVHPWHWRKAMRAAKFPITPRRAEVVWGFTNLLGQCQDWAEPRATEGLWPSPCSPESWPGVQPPSPRDTEGSGASAAK